MKSVSGSLYLVTSENDQAITPQVKRPSKDERMALLTMLQAGELSIEDAPAQLG